MKTLMKIIKRRKVGKAGVVLAFPDSATGEIRYGWSLCNFSAGDTFNKDFGMNLAESRAVPANELAKLALFNQIPHTCRRELGKMLCRSEHYFHTI